MKYLILFFQLGMDRIFIEFQLSQYLITKICNCWRKPDGKCRSFQLKYWTKNQNWLKLMSIFVITTYVCSILHIQFQLSNWKTSKEKIFYGNIYLSVSLNFDDKIRDKNLAYDYNINCRKLMNLVIKLNRILNSV